MNTKSPDEIHNASGVIVQHNENAHIAIVPNGGQFDLYIQTDHNHQEIQFKYITNLDPQRVPDVIAALTGAPTGYHLMRDMDVVFGCSGGSNETRY